MENLKKGFITPNQASYTLPILFILKKNGSLYFYIDYYKLNALIKKDRYLLPLIKETLIRVVKYKYLIKIDIIIIFNSLHISPESEALITFITNIRAYIYKVIPFGLINNFMT